MRNESLLRSREACYRWKGCRAFSLVEVVLALGICVFALVAMLGLLSTGLSVGQDSREQLQAANLATLLVSERRNSPTNTYANVLLPSLNQALPTTPVTTYVDSSGHFTSQALADYQLSYQVGTNVTAPNVGLIHLRFTWPPGANPTTAEGKYELTTQVLMP